MNKNFNLNLASRDGVSTETQIYSGKMPPNKFCKKN